MFRTATGQSRGAGEGRVVTYSVEIEQGLPLAPSAAARVVDRVLQHPRGWTGVEPVRLQRVATDPDFHIRIATPSTTDQLCAPLETGGRLSCRNGEDVVLNAWRWFNGADAYDGDLPGYRTYLVNHEFGHALGNDHESCAAEGSPASVMVQQTKGLDGCTANPWPT